MKRFSAVSLLFVCLAVPPAGAQLVRGTAGMLTANTGRCCPAQFFTVKFCLADKNNFPTNQCAAHTLDSTGIYSYDVGLGTGNYYVYFWRDDPLYFGSDTYPNFGPVPVSRDAIVNDFTPATVTPRTLPPAAVYPPSGAVNVPASIVLQWRPGLDLARNSRSWPVSYDIYASGQEFPETKVIENYACPTAHDMDLCSYPIPNLQYETRYQWRIVGKMKSGPLVPLAGLDNSYLQTSQTFRFSTTWNPATPYYSIATANGSLWRAAGGGGSTLAANGSASTYETQFKLQDENGGTLNAGDPVCIYTNRAYYLTAPGGSGTVTANQQSCLAYETFAYEPVSGGVAFRSTWSGLYMSATGGGGGSITVSASTAGPNETFRLQ